MAEGEFKRSYVLCDLSMKRCLNMSLKLSGIPKFDYKLSFSSVYHAHETKTTLLMSVKKRP